MCVVRFFFLRPSGANKIITGSYQGMLRMCASTMRMQEISSGWHSTPPSSSPNNACLTCSLCFRRYYPKQKEYKIEDLILESNMEATDIRQGYLALACKRLLHCTCRASRRRSFRLRQADLSRAAASQDFWKECIGRVGECRTGPSKNIAQVERSAWLCFTH